MERSIVVPVYNGADTISACLSALLAQVGDNDEIIVVDDGSSDQTPMLVAAMPVRMVRTPAERSGAAAARNVGAAVAQGDVLVFVDADVVVSPGGLDRLCQALCSGVVAAVGRYGGCDPQLGLWAWIKNTTIRVNHASAGADIAWFWTAFGAVNRDAFVAAGGFDQAHFRAPSVEDMDLGFRLTAKGGRIRQVFDAVATHHHRFGPLDLLCNDFSKSRDWAHLLLRTGMGRANAHGSTHLSEVASLVCAIAAVGGLILVPFEPRFWTLVALGLVGLAVLMRRAIELARRERGAGSALVFLGVRALLYPVSALGALLGIVQGYTTRGNLP